VQETNEKDTQSEEKSWILVRLKTDKQIYKRSGGRKTKKERTQTKRGGVGWGIEEKMGQDQPKKKEKGSEKGWTGIGMGKNREERVGKSGNIVYFPE